MWIDMLICRCLDKLRSWCSVNTIELVSQTPSTPLIRWLPQIQALATGCVRGSWPSCRNGLLQMETQSSEYPRGDQQAHRS
jgi:hypothetical protein